MVFGHENDGSTDAKPAQNAGREAVFEALRVQMQKIEDRWRTHSPRAAEIIDEIGSSSTMDQILRHLSDLELHIRTGKNTASAGAGGVGVASPRRAVRTLLRL